MEYVINGQGDKAIIFLHGWGGGYESFLSAAGALCTRFVTVNVSFFNEMEVMPLTLNDYVEFVKSIVIRLKTEQKCSYVTVVGHSFGGRVGIRLASENMIDRLILTDSAGLKPRRGFKYLFRRIKRLIFKIFKLNVLVGSPDFIALKGARRQTFINIVNTYQDNELTKINIPVLLFWGGQDKDTPLYMARKIKRKVKDSALIVVKNGGHFAYLDDYKQFIAAVNSFASF